jgi:hypothetical protein
MQSDLVLEEELGGAWRIGVATGHDCQGDLPEVAETEFGIWRLRIQGYRGADGDGWHFGWRRWDRCRRRSEGHPTTLDHLVETPVGGWAERAGLLEVGKRLSVLPLAIRLEALPKGLLGTIRQTSEWIRRGRRIRAASATADQ